MAFQYHNQSLYAEDIPIEALVKRFKTPLYVYSHQALKSAYDAFENALKSQPHLITYAVKANSNLALLQCLAQWGSGFDIVSGGELKKVLKAGGSPQKTVFSGVGKTAQEIKEALDAQILCFNVESQAELSLIASLAEHSNQKASIALRVNPDIDPKVHPYISTGLKENKFGIPLKDVENLYLKANNHPHLEVKGIACHIGSQVMRLSPFIEAATKLVEIQNKLLEQGISIDHLDIGGGLGIATSKESAPCAQDFVDAILNKVQQPHLKLIIAPGRSIVAKAGLLITEVLLTKEGEKNFCVVDAAMNDILRPALYDAWHPILPVIQSNAPTKTYDVVGPICESSDFLAKDRSLNLKPHDLLAIAETGAYGASMSSQYNSRPRAAEVLVQGNKSHCVRVRETFEDLIQHESLLA